VMSPFTTVLGPMTQVLADPVPGAAAGERAGAGCERGAGEEGVAAGRGGVSGGLFSVLPKIPI
jgi:hypothetical protein